MNKTSYKKFSLNERRASLRKFREEADLSIEDVARMAGLSKSMLSRFETGKRDLSPKAFARLEKTVIRIVKDMEIVRLRKEETKKREAAKVETLAGRFAGIKLAVLAGGDIGTKALEEYRESCQLMEEQYGPRWREVFKEIRDLQREKSDLEKRIAELRDLLGLETKAALKREQAQEAVLNESEASE